MNNPGENHSTWQDPSGGGSEEWLDPDGRGAEVVKEFSHPQGLNGLI